MSSQQQVIEYRVKDAKNFEPKPKYKQILKINQKVNDFRFREEQDIFQIQLLLKVPAIVNNVAMKIRYANQVAFQFYNGQHKQYVHQVSLQTQQSAVGVTKFVKLLENAKMFDRIVIRFLNYPLPQATLINHIILRGFKNQQSKKVINKVKNVSTEDQFLPSTKKKVKENEKQIFNLRNKERQIRKTSVQDLINQVQANKKFATQQSKNNDSYEEQLKKAMQMSKKQMQQKNKHKQNTTNKSHNDQQRQMREVIELDAEEQFFDYDLIDYEKVKNVFQHVTPQWVEAQRKAQQERKVLSRHSLANRIKIKVFVKTDFCINNINGRQRMRLMDLIKQLGGNIIEQPKENCVIVTNTMEGGKIELGKLLNKVRFVKPEYIDDCNKFKAKMDQKTYRVGQV